MLADGIDIIVCTASSAVDADEHQSTKELILNIKSSIGFCSRLTNHRISAQQKAD
jgi:hypothetical protein